MAIAANTSIALGISQAKKDATVAVPGILALDSEVRIGVGATVDVNKTQLIVGTLEKLHAYAQTTLKDVSGGHVISASLGAGDIDIAIGAGGPGSVFLDIGADVCDTKASHFLDRTFKRLRERWLEESKSGAA